jgi:hypothetical protein
MPWQAAKFFRFYRAFLGPRPSPVGCPVLTQRGVLRALFWRASSDKPSVCTECPSGVILPSPLPTAVVSEQVVLAAAATVPPSQ